MVGALITTPADVVTTRIMTRQEVGTGADAALLGPIATAQEIFESEGPAGFARGAVSRGLYWTPAIGIFLSLYCTLRQVALNLLSSTPG